MSSRNTIQHITSCGEAKVTSQPWAPLRLYAECPNPNGYRRYPDGHLQGILYLLSPVTFTMLTRYPRLQAYCAPTGLVVTVIGSLLSSFSKTVWHLIATQGVMCAIGNGLLFSPSSLYLDQWFVRRKGLALGMMWAAKSVTGVALPFITSACLNRFGSSTTLRAWTVTTV